MATRSCPKHPYWSGMSEDCPFCSSLRAAERKASDLRRPGEAFCGDCPDRAACADGIPCSVVQAVGGVA